MRDETGRTARQRAFESFERGHTVDEVVEEMEISRETVRHYFYVWRKRDENLEWRYHSMKHSMKANPEFSEKVVGTLAEALGMTKEEVRARLIQPSGLKSAMLGHWPNPHLEKVQGEVEARLTATLDLINGIEKGGLSAEEQIAVIENLLAEASRKRQSADG